MYARLQTMLDLGLGYLTLERSTPTLSPGELQRLRLATQVRSNLFGVVYVLDEPSAGLHPADTEALLTALDRLKAAGNSLFVVEHELDVIRHADWIVDVGPGAGEQGGEILYSGPPRGLRQVAASRHGDSICLTNQASQRRHSRAPADGCGCGVTRNNLRAVDVRIPARRAHGGHRRFRFGQIESGQPGAGRAGGRALGHRSEQTEEEADNLEAQPRLTLGGHGWPSGAGAYQAPGHGRPEADRPHAPVEPRDIHRPVRPSPPAFRRHGGRQAPENTTPVVFRSMSPKAGAETCEGEGFVCVELLFMPSVYTPCPTCHGARYNAKHWKLNIAIRPSPTC